jgi:acetyl esterase
MSPEPADKPSIVQRRSSVQPLLSPSGAPAVEGRSVPVAGGLDVRLHEPAGGHAELLPGLRYCHDGGLLAGSSDTHGPSCRAFAKAGGSKLVWVYHRSAPEHRFPAALDNGQAAVRWVFTHARELRIDPDFIGIGGTRGAP